MKHCSMFGHGFVPNTDIRVVHEGGGYHLQTNSQGYRCIERDQEANSASAPIDGRATTTRPLRVAVFGDSFTAGDGVDNAQRWTDRLQSAWEVDLHNFAVSGTGPDQNLLLAESLDLDSFDLIVWAMATHTIGRIQMSDRLTLNRRGKVRRVARPHFVLKNGDLELVPMPEEEPSAMGGQDDPASSNPDSRWKTSFIAPARSLGRNAIDAFRRTVRPRSDHDYTTPSSEGWQLFSAIAERMIHAAGSTPLVIIPLPTRAHLRGELGAVYRERFHDLHRGLAQRNGRGRNAVHVVDILKPVLEASRRTEAKLAFDFDGHYTPEGHLALATAIAKDLAAHPAETLEGTLPHLPLTPAEPASTAACSIEARWSLADSEGRVVIANAQLPPLGHLPWQSEASFSGELEVAGTLPWSAIAAALGRAHSFGSGVTATRLESPIGPTELAAHHAPFDEWVEVAAPWIRWHGAAEIDLRQIFGITSRVEYVVARQPGLWDGARRQAGLSPAAGSRGDDPEAAWLRRRLRPIHAKMDASKRTAGLERLAIEWERATRRARYTCLPLPAPTR
ncbi:MAG: carbamoyltransferase [Planctomycetota bacterium]|jgi:carbamoyltransferase